MWMHPNINHLAPITVEMWKCWASLREAGDCHCDFQRGPQWTTAEERVQTHRSISNFSVWSEEMSHHWRRACTHKAGSTPGTSKRQKASTKLVERKSALHQMRMPIEWSKRERAREKWYGLIMPDGACFTTWISFFCKGTLMFQICRSCWMAGDCRQGRG